MTVQQRQRAVQGALYVLLVGMFATAVLVPDWSRIQEGFFNPSVAAGLFPRVLTIAARNTILYTALAFAAGTAAGLVLALMKLSSIRPYRWIATIYIELFRGLPALITLILVGFGIPIVLGVTIPGGFLGQGTVGLGIVASAYTAETIRAGIQAVPVGQMEAARSLGMSRARAMVSIVIPQAFRVIVPPLTNELVLLLKDTSLLFVLGTTATSVELTQFARNAQSATFNGTPLVVVALVYLAITLPLTQLVAVLERRQGRAR